MNAKSIMSAALLTMYTLSANAAVIVMDGTESVTATGTDHVNVLDGADARDLTLTESSTALMSGGHISFITTKNDSALVIDNGSVSGGIMAHDNSIVTVNNVVEGVTTTGAVDSFGFTMLGDSTLYMYGGVLDWAWLWGRSVTHLYGSDLPSDGDTRLVIKENAVIHVYGLGLEYNDFNKVTGTWGNGEPFSIGVVADDGTTVGRATNKQLILHTYDANSSLVVQTSVNNAQLGVGDSLVINTEITNSSIQDEVVDVKVWLHFPNGDVYSLSRMSNYVVGPNAMDVMTNISYVINGSEPVGAYTVKARLLNVNTGDIIYDDVTSFEVIPGTTN